MNLLNKAGMRRFCRDHGKGAPPAYLERLERRVAEIVCGHCRSTGRRRLDPNLVGPGIQANAIGRRVAAAILLALGLVVAPRGWSGELVKITHYCPCPVCCGAAGRGLTFTGTSARPGVAAVSRDPGKRLFPLGARILVPGIGELSIEDVGGGVGEGELDVCCSTHEEAIRRGVLWIDLCNIRPTGGIRK